MFMFASVAATWFLLLTLTVVNTAPLLTSHSNSCLNTLQDDYIIEVNETFQTAPNISNNEYCVIGQSNNIDTIATVVVAPSYNDLTVFEYYASTNTTLTLANLIITDSYTTTSSGDEQQLEWQFINGGWYSNYSQLYLSNINFDNIKNNISRESAIFGLYGYGYPAFSNIEFDNVTFTNISQHTIIDSIQAEITKISNILIDGGSINRFYSNSGSNIIILSGIILNNVEIIGNTSLIDIWNSNNTVLIENFIFDHTTNRYLFDGYDSVFLLQECNYSMIIKDIRIRSAVFGFNGEGGEVFGLYYNYMVSINNITMTGTIINDGFLLSGWYNNQTVINDIRIVYNQIVYTEDTATRNIDEDLYTIGLFSFGYSEECILNTITISLNLIEGELFYHYLCKKTLSINNLFVIWNTFTLDYAVLPLNYDWRPLGNVELTGVIISNINTKDIYSFDDSTGTSTSTNDETSTSTSSPAYTTTYTTTEAATTTIGLTGFTEEPTLSTTTGPESTAPVPLRIINSNKNGLGSFDINSKITDYSDFLHFGSTRVNTTVNGLWLNSLNFTVKEHVLLLECWYWNITQYFELNTIILTDVRGIKAVVKLQDCNSGEYIDTNVFINELIITDKWPQDDLSELQLYNWDTGSFHGSSAHALWMQEMVQVDINVLWLFTNRVGDTVLLIENCLNVFVDTFGLNFQSNDYTADINYDNDGINSGSVEQILHILDEGYLKRHVTSGDRYYISFNNGSIINYIIDSSNTTDNDKEAAIIINIEDGIYWDYYTNYSFTNIWFINNIKNGSSNDYNNINISKSIDNYSTFFRIDDAVAHGNRSVNELMSVWIEYCYFGDNNNFDTLFEVRDSENLRVDIVNCVFENNICSGNLRANKTTTNSTESMVNLIRIAADSVNVTIIIQNGIFIGNRNESEIFLIENGYWDNRNNNSIECINCLFFQTSSDYYQYFYTTTEEPIANIFINTTDIGINDKKDKDKSFLGLGLSTEELISIGIFIILFFIAFGVCWTFLSKKRKKNNQANKNVKEMASTDNCNNSTHNVDSSKPPLSSIASNSASNHRHGSQHQDDHDESNVTMTNKGDQQNGEGVGNDNNNNGLDINDPYVRQSNGGGIELAYGGDHDVNNVNVVDVDGQSPSAEGVESMDQQVKQLASVWKATNSPQLQSGSVAGSVVPVPENVTKGGPSLSVAMANESPMMESFQGDNNNRLGIDVNDINDEPVVKLDNSYFNQLDEQMDNLENGTSSIKVSGEEGQFGKQLNNAFQVEDAMIDDIVQHMSTKR